MLLSAIAHFKSAVFKGSILKLSSMAYWDAPCLTNQLTKVCVCCLSICAFPCYCIVLFIAFIIAQSTTLTPLAKMDSNIPIVSTKPFLVIVNPYIWPKKPPSMSTHLAWSKDQSHSKVCISPTVKLMFYNANILCIALPLPFTSYSYPC